MWVFSAAAPRQRPEHFPKLPRHCECDAVFLTQWQEWDKNPCLNLETSGLSLSVSCLLGKLANFLLVQHLILVGVVPGQKNHPALCTSFHIPVLPGYALCQVLGYANHWIGPRDLFTGCHYIWWRKKKHGFRFPLNCLKPIIPLIERCRKVLDLVHVSAVLRMCPFLSASANSVVASTSSHRADLPWFSCEHWEFPLDMFDYESASLWIVCG